MPLEKEAELAAGVGERQKIVLLTPKEIQDCSLASSFVGEASRHVPGACSCVGELLPQRIPRA